MRVSLEESWRCAESRQFFENVYAMYVHELSAYGRDCYALDDRGRWQPALAPAWTAGITPATSLLEARSPADPGQPFQRGYVIRSGLRRVGFVCVGLPPFRYMFADSQVRLAELFLIHDQRASGTAALALREAFVRHRGRWELRVFLDNTRAVAFFRRALPALGARGLVGYERDGELVTRFEIA